MRSPRLLARDEGAALAEYGVLLLLVALVCVAVVTALGLRVRELFVGVVGSLP